MTMKKPSKMKTQPANLDKQLEQLKQLQARGIAQAIARSGIRFESAGENSSSLMIQAIARDGCRKKHLAASNLPPSGCCKRSRRTPALAARLRRPEKRPRRQ